MNSEGDSFLVSAIVFISSPSPYFNGRGNPAPTAIIIRNGLGSANPYLNGRGNLINTIALAIHSVDPLRLRTISHKCPHSLESFFIVALCEIVALCDIPARIPCHYRLPTDFIPLNQSKTVALCDSFNPTTITLSARPYPSKTSLSQDL